MGFGRNERFFFFFFSKISKNMINQIYVFISTCIFFLMKSCFLFIHSPPPIYIHIKLRRPNILWSPLWFFDPHYIFHPLCDTLITSPFMWNRLLLQFFFFFFFFFFFLLLIVVFIIMIILTFLLFLFTEGGDVCIWETHTATQALYAKGKWEGEEGGGRGRRWGKLLGEEGEGSEGEEGKVGGGEGNTWKIFRKFHQKEKKGEEISSFSSSLSSSFSSSLSSSLSSSFSSSLSSSLSSSFSSLSPPSPITCACVVGDGLYLVTGDSLGQVYVCVCVGVGVCVCVYVCLYACMRVCVLCMFNLPIFS